MYEAQLSMTLPDGKMWVHRFDVQEWEKTPDSQGGELGAYQLHTRSVLETLGNRLDQVYAEYWDLDDETPMSLSIADPESETPSFEVYEFVHWLDTDESQTYPGGEVLVFYPLNGAEALAYGEKFVDKYGEYLRSETAKPADSLAPDENRDRLCFSGCDIQARINDRPLLVLESVTWMVDKDGSVAGTMVCSQYEQHPIYELLGVQPVLGHGEVLNSEGGVIRSGVDMDPFDLTLIYSLPNHTSVAQILGIKITGEQNGASHNDLTAAVGFHFTARALVPLRTVTSSAVATGGSLKAPPQDFSWHRTTS